MPWAHAWPRRGPRHATAMHCPAWSRGAARGLAGHECLSCMSCSSSIVLSAGHHRVVKSVIVSGLDALADQVLLGGADQRNAC